MGSQRQGPCDGHVWEGTTDVIACAICGAPKTDVIIAELRARIETLEQALDRLAIAGGAEGE